MISIAFGDGNPVCLYRLRRGVMLSSVEAWWAGLYALPFDGAQGDTPPFHTFFIYKNLLT